MGKSHLWSHGYALGLRYVLCCVLKQCKKTMSIISKKLITVSPFQHRLYSTAVKIKMLYRRMNSPVVQKDSVPKYISQSLQVCQHCHIPVQSLSGLTWVPQQTTSTLDGSWWTELTEKWLFLGSLSLVYFNSLFSGRDCRLVLAIVNVSSDVLCLPQEHLPARSRDHKEISPNVHLAPGLHHEVTPWGKAPEWKWLIKPHDTTTCLTEKRVWLKHWKLTHRWLQATKKHKKKNRGKKSLKEICNQGSTPFLTRSSVWNC